jgi:hypothetical protein
VKSQNIVKLARLLAKAERDGITVEPHVYSTGATCPGCYRVSRDGVTDGFVVNGQYEG